MWELNKAADKWDSDSYLATVVAGWNMQDNKMFLVQTAYSFSRMRQLGRKGREREGDRLSDYLKTEQHWEGELATGWQSTIHISWFSKQKYSKRDNYTAAHQRCSEMTAIEIQICKEEN